MFFLAIYRYFNLLNLDVVAGAVICSMAFARLLDVEVSWAALSLLGFTIWSIYTFDRLMDGRYKKDALQSDRHRFHNRRGSLLSWLLVACILFSAILLFFIPPTTVLWGATLACGVLAYLATIHLLKIKWLVHKEVVIATIYTLGVMLAPLSIYQGDYGISFLLCGVIFFTIVLYNLLVFSMYDEDFDSKSDLPSLVTVLGKKPVNTLLHILSVFLIVSILLGYINYVNPVFIVFFFMSTVLIIIHRYAHHHFFQLNYRFIGDAVFLLPVVLL
ncbi:MAG: UbiA family prenyltransferase [Bacteroidota bacterium]